MSRGTLLRSQADGEFRPARVIDDGLPSGRPEDAGREEEENGRMRS